MSLFVSALIFQSPNLGLGTSKGRQCRGVNGQKKVFMKCRAGPVLSITIHRQSPGAADTGHSHYCWLLSLIWPLTVTTAVPPPDVWRVSCLLLPHTHSSHDSRPRTSWKTIISQEDKLGQTIERNSQLIPSQKDTSSCIINHFTTISVFILYLLIVLCITVDRSCTASKRQEIQNKAWTWENFEYLEEIVFTLVRVEFEMQNRRVLTLPDTMIQTLPHSSRVQG